MFFKMRRSLGTTAFGINEVRLPAGLDGIEHDEVETGHEEVYIVLEGSGTMKVDGDAVALGEGDYLRVDAESTRLVTAGPGGLTYVVVAGKAAAGIRRPPVSVSSITGVHHVQVAAPPGCEDAARAVLRGLARAHRGREAPAPRDSWRVLVSRRGGGVAHRRRGALRAGDQGAPRVLRRVRRSARAACIVSRERGDRGSLGGRRRDPDPAAVSLSDPWGNRLEVVAARRELTRSRGSERRGL